jgi:ubiquinone/menaquinone biosynthesis C-methylase UbiE
LGQGLNACSNIKFLLIRHLNETGVKAFKYDQTDIHRRYRESRQLPEKTMALWLDALAKYVNREEIKTIIDVGCGTGRFTKGLADKFSAKVYGIDPSCKMLTVAKQTIVSPMVAFIQGLAEDIPLREGLADMLFVSMVYHHIQDEIKAVCEFKRILRAGGFLCIRTSTTDSLDCYLYLRFFPEARQIDLSTLPSREEMVKFLRNNEFKLKAHAIIKQKFAENLNEYFEKISLRGLSDLAKITDDEFQEGLSRLKKYCQEQKTEEAIYEDIDLYVFHLI